MVDLLIVPESGLETEAVFLTLHSDSYPLKIEGEIILTDDCVPPQIVLFGNNIVAKDDPRFP